MIYQEMDDDMKELFGALSKAVVPMHRRQAVVRTNRHVPYYNDARYKRI